MKKNKLLACLLSAAMLMGSCISAFAYAPSYYDGQAYESVGYVSEDPDNEINLAVIASGDVYLVKNSMLIEGSIYTTGNIYVGDGEGNIVKGFFISGGNGSIDDGLGSTDDRECLSYIHVKSDGTIDDTNAYSSTLQYEGSIIDSDTSFECSYEDFVVPEIANDLGDTTMNVYEWDETKKPKTIKEDTKFGVVSMLGSDQPCMTIDTTNGDVTVVIDSIDWNNTANINIQVVGDNVANIYISDVEVFNGVTLNYGWDTTTWTPMITGNSEKTNLYLAGENVSIQGGTIAANVIINAETVEVLGTAKIVGDVTSGAESFVLTDGDTSITGTLCVPNAVTEIVDNGTLYGQLHTKDLEMNGLSSILYKTDAAALPAPEATEAPTAEPTEAPEPTEPPVMPAGPEKDYSDFNYAYIFGYEPYNADDGSIILEMAPEQKLTREQVCAMLVRVDDQYNNKVGKSRYLEDGIFNEDASSDRWSYNALAAVAETNAFDGKTDLDPAGHVSRAEVARIVAFMTGLTETDDEIVFEDAVGHEDEVYINLVATAGYMQGYEDGTFDPGSAITRAEFCTLLNNIIGRNSDNGYYLETADGSPVTHATYSISDLEPSDWYYETVLYATSAFDDSGKVDLQLRMQNIRNKLDGFDAQYDY